MLVFYTLISKSRNPDLPLENGTTKGGKGKAVLRDRFSLLLFARIRTDSEGFASLLSRRPGAHHPGQGPLRWVALNVNSGQTVGHTKQPINPEYPPLDIHREQSHFQPPPREGELPPSMSMKVPFVTDTN